MRLKYGYVIGLRHVGEPGPIVARETKGAHTRDGGHLPISETHDHQRLVVVVGRRVAPAPCPLDFRLRRLSADDDVLAVRRDLRRWRRWTARAALACTARRAPETARCVVGPTEIPTRDAVFGSAGGGSNDRLSVAHLRDQAIDGPLAVGRERRRVDGLPDVPVRLRQDFLLRLRDGGHGEQRRQCDRNLSHREHRRVRGRTRQGRGVTQNRTSSYDPGPEPVARRFIDARLMRNSTLAAPYDTLDHTTTYRS